MKKVIPFTKEIPFKTMISEITDINLEHDLEVFDNTIEGNFTVSGKYKMTDASVIEEEFLHKLPFTIEMDDKYDLTDSKISINDFYFEIINEEILKVNIEVLIDGFKDKPLKSDISLDVEDIRKTLEVNMDDTELMDKEEVLPPSNIEVKVDDMEVKESGSMMDEVEKIKINDISEPIKIDVPSSIEVLDTDTNVVTSNQSVNTNQVDDGVSSIFSSMSSDETFSTYHVYIVRENDTLEQILDRYKVLKEDVGNYNDLNDIKVGSKLIIPCSSNE